MNADQELKDAYIERLAKENTFFNYLKKSIKDAVNEFDLCDTSTSPEVEESVQLSIAGLNDTVRKLKEETVLNKETAKNITQWFDELAQRNHLVQDAKPATSSTPQRSFADRAKGWLGIRAPAPAAPAPATPVSLPFAESRLNRALGRYGIPDQRWIGNSSQPVTPIYQAEPYKESENPYGKGGTRRRSRKSRRRV